MMQLPYSKTFILPFIFGLFLVSTSSNAQGSESKILFSGDLTARYISGQMGGSVGLSGLYGFGEKKKFRMGLGIRMTSNAGKNQDFQTAPPKLTDKEENMDTMRLSDYSIHAINLAIYFLYNLTPSLSIGFNIDAVGFSFGKEQTGTLNSTYGNFSPKAKPTSGNVLLVGDNDIGTLNSEFFVHYMIGKRVGIKGGISYLFTEYTTDQKYILDNDRFRNQNVAGMLGLTYFLN